MVVRIIFNTKRLRVTTDILVSYTYRIAFQDSACLGFHAQQYPPSFLFMVALLSLAKFKIASRSSAIGGRKLINSGRIIIMPIVTEQASAPVAFAGADRDQCLPAAGCHLPFLRSGNFSTGTLIPTTALSTEAALAS
jgi:hypothetical protein